ncbi:uncharacterized protein LOC110710605 [Chenopodium quinoa]|uniref:uncharacterized protein LOC110710605 n=1 Tax=Chenopodium quinoa TaxID=63459 RepID=UPI000B78CCD5|nr:uncharacterized protein LOC110710605 [Chenopodium quinoa]
MYVLPSFFFQRKDSYIAEANKRNSVENNAWPERASRKSAKPRKSARSRRDKDFDMDIWDKAMGIFMMSLKQKHLKNDPKFNFKFIGSFSLVGLRMAMELRAIRMLSHSGNYLESGCYVCIACEGGAGVLARTEYTAEELVNHT